METKVKFDNDILHRSKIIKLNKEMNHENTFEKDEQVKKEYNE